MTWWKAMIYHYLQELTSLLLRNEELKDTIKNLEEEMVFYQGMLSIQTSDQIETGPASPEQQVPGLWTVEEDFLEQYLWCMRFTVVVPTRSLVAEEWLLLKMWIRDVFFFITFFDAILFIFFSNENFLILLSFNQTRISYIWFKKFRWFSFSHWNSFCSQLFLRTQIHLYLFIFHPYSRLSSQGK